MQHLAQQWRALQKRKEARQAAYRRALDSVPGDEERAAIQACITAARNAQSMEALEDVEARFAMVLPAPEESLADLDLDGFSQDPAGGSQIPSQEGPQGAARRRMPRRVTAHQIAIRAGLREAATALGMTGRQFGENIQASYKRNEPVDPSLTPEDYALEFINPERAARATPEAVLRSIVSIAAAELAAEPAARQFVRDFFWKRAEVTTELLPAGESALNPFHPLGVAKRLKHKPVKKFYDTDLFLKLAAAEGEGFVKLTIDLPVQKGPDNQPMVPDLQAVVSDLNDFYLSTGLSDEAEAWNKLRTAALREAITSHILPAIRREVRARLMAEGRVFLLQELTDALWEHASQAPIMLRAMEDNEEGEELSEKRIMSVVYSPGGGAATTLVMLDPAGQMVDYLHCPQLTGVIPKPRLIQGQTYSIFQDPRKATDAEAIRTFIEAHLPHAILVGVSHPDALNLLADVEMVCADILSINPRLLQTLETQDLRVEAADETLAALWGNSAAAREELPSSAPIVRKGVALARQALEPLAVLSSLCGPSKEVLSLRLHPLQGHLPEDERMRVIDEVLCAAVAQVGVDVNAAVAAPWRAAPLAFVPGLGPRKAAALLRTVARAGGHVESRRQIWKELGVMGNCVFRNAAPFLRVRASSAATANIELDVLDDTRVHPESYNHAVAIAQSVSQTDDATVALENAMAQPEEVEKLELELYDRHLQEEAAAAAAAEPDGEDGDGEGKGRRAVGTKLATLIDIQFEFVAPYGEMRPPRSRLDVDGRFWLALGEDRSTLKPGRKVEAQVKYVNSAFVKCVVPELNGFEAEIPATAVSSKPGQETVDCRDYFKKGDTVVAVVMEVLPKESKVLLATSSRMLNNDLTWEKEYMTKLGECAV